MSSTVTSSPAGRPSTITTSACPCDSPAVRKRSTRNRCRTRRPHLWHPRRRTTGAVRLGAAARIAAGRGGCRSTAPAGARPGGRASRGRRRVRQPALARRVEQRRVERVVHEVDDDVAGRGAAPGRTAARRLSEADRRGVDTIIGAGEVVGRADPPGTAPAAQPPRPASAVRLTTTTSAAPARPRASTTLRAAAPAPSTATTSRRRRRRRPSASAATKPVAVGAVAVEPPVGGAHDGVHRPQRRAAGASSSTAAATSSLCGVVTDSPAMPSVRIAVERPRRRRRPHLEGDVRPSRGRRRAKAALWMRRRQRVADRRADHARATPHAVDRRTRITSPAAAGRPARGGDVGLVLLAA